MKKTDECGWDLSHPAWRTSWRDDFIVTETGQKIYGMRLRALQDKEQSQPEQTVHGERATENRLLYP